jgi:alkanesulfonate monooxygenase SsuD/methylene tetrahydromethanopterin reductase-like flavin-dependent oxidoreductase (luciferase family)
MTDVEFGFVASAADAPGTADHELYGCVLDDVEYHAGLGYTTAWLIEHHFSDYFPTPSPLLLASHIAARFPELSLGTCVLVTPWYQPLRLAGEIAMLSLLTRQHLHLGLGRGTAKYEFDAFGLDMDQSRQRFQEAYEILSLALAGEPFSYQGSYLQVPKQITVRPRVAGVSSDRIHFYGAIGSPGSAEIMAQLGLPPICTTIGDFDTQVGILRRWEGAVAAGGGSTGAVTKPIMINCIVADTDDEAVSLAQQYIPRFMQAQLDHYTPDEVDWEKLESYRSWRGQFAGMKSKTDPASIPGWAQFQLVGSPDTVARKTARYIEAGFNHIFVHAATPGVPHQVRREWTARFAREVAPRFAPRASHAGAVA